MITRIERIDEIREGRDAGKKRGKKKNKKRVIEERLCTEKD